VKTILSWRRRTRGFSGRKTKELQRIIQVPDDDDNDDDDDDDDGGGGQGDFLDSRRRSSRG